MSLHILNISIWEFPVDLQWALPTKNSNDIFLNPHAIKIFHKRFHLITTLIPHTLDTLYFKRISFFQMNKACNEFHPFETNKLIVGKLLQGLHGLVIYSDAVSENHMQLRFIITPAWLQFAQFPFHDKNPCRIFFHFVSRRHKRILNAKILDSSWPGITWHVWIT